MNKAEMGRLAGNTVGATGASAVMTAVVSAAGTSGLSAAGITSGLAAVGVTLMGGVIVCMGVVAASTVGVGYLGYWLCSRKK